MSGDQKQSPQHDAAAESAPEVVENEEMGEVIDLSDADGESGVELIDDPAAELRDELDQTLARLRTVSSAYQKLQEEMVAFKARLERQAALKEEILRGDVVSALFEPFENLRRSIDALERSGMEKDLLQGMEMVHKNFLDGFHKMGLEEMGVEGEAFDPNIHEALTTMPVPEESMGDTVVNVFSKGFKLGNRVIRPARVVIGAWTEPAGDA